MKIEEFNNWRGWRYQPLLGYIIIIIIIIGSSVNMMLGLTWRYNSTYNVILWCYVIWELIAWPDIIAFSSHVKTQFITFHRVITSSINQIMGRGSAVYVWKRVCVSLTENQWN